jgi:hypothetical protein
LEPDERRAKGRGRGDEEIPRSHRCATKDVRGLVRVVGLPQPKGAGGLWPTQKELRFFERATPSDRAEAPTVKSRGTERRGPQRELRDPTSRNC